MPFIPPMLATRLEDPPRLADPRYIAEPKLDAQRAQVHVRGGRARSNLTPIAPGVRRC
jgi:ATP-dependent DNA ligase